MDSYSGAATTVAVDPRHISYTHIMYALHAVSILTGAAGSAFIATYFVFGLPSIVAVVMNYVRRPLVRGTWLESHFRWQLRTFWITLLVLVLLSPLVITIVLIPVVILATVALGLWAMYRIARGWLALRDGRSLPVT
ncbi:MAG TPA: hypothetical protein VEQ17_11555 [Steroidobacteraceae bacterium]|nr:hypothetical protein [Steroidobacteraceae bacterium]